MKEEFTPTLFPLPGTNNILFAYNTKIGQPNYVEPLESKDLDKVLDMGLSIVKSKGTEEEKTKGVIIVAEDKMVNVSLDSSRKQFRPINATVKNCQEQIKDLVREFNRDLNTELKKGAISFEKSPEKSQKPSRRLRYRGPDR